MCIRLKIVENGDKQQICKKYVKQQKYEIQIAICRICTPTLLMAAGQHRLRDAIFPGMTSTTAVPATAPSSAICFALHAKHKSSAGLATQ